MEKPNTLESVTPLSGQYSCKKDLRLNAWLVVAGSLHLITLVLLRHYPSWSPLTRGLVALTPLLPGLLYVRDCLRFVRGMDELQRRIQVESWMLAALGTLIVAAVINTLNAHGVSLGAVPHGLGLGGMFFVMFALWLVGLGIANCRYK